MSPADLIPCVAQIPLTYGDSGAAVEPEKMLLIHKAIVRQFGGLTPLGTIKGGIWVDETEHRDVEEDQLRIEVWVPRSRLPDFERLVRIIGHETRQKEMFFVIPEARVARLVMHETDPGSLGL
jgi:hypothetical protein